MAKIDITYEELRKRKLFVGVPMFNAQCDGAFAQSMNQLAVLCLSEGIQMTPYYSFNESLITRGRAYIADEFLRSDCTHLLFIDADISFNPQDVLIMLALQGDDSEYDILCAPYGKKSISWGKIRDAVNQGFADENPSQLSEFVGDYVFNPIQAGEFSIHEPAEVSEAGTGFMMIRRNTFERFSKAYPELSYLPDHVYNEHFDGSREITMFFDCPIDGKRRNIENELDAFLDKNPEANKKQIMDFVRDSKNSMFQYTNRYLSEDYAFCAWSRKIGMKVWLCPWIRLVHWGKMPFGGSLEALASIKASLTVDEGLVKKR